MSTRATYIIALLAAIALLARPMDAQVTPYDFAGTYDMVHDGWPGVLYLGDGKADCPAPLCLSHYIDESGRDYRVEISTSSYELTFYVIGLAGQNADRHGGQKFKGYLMTQTLDALAGTTWWEQRPFGFYARKRPESGGT